MITEIKKGDRFRCVKNWTDDDRGIIKLHKEGSIYISDKDGCIIDSQGESHEWDTGASNDYFKLIGDEDLAQDLTREAIEQNEVESVERAKINWSDEPAKPMTDIRDVVNAANAGKFTEEEMAVMLGLYENTPTPDVSITTGRIKPDSLESRQFDTGSKRDNDDNKPLVNHIDPYTRLRFGHLLRAGATKYGINNWRLGQPTETALESLHRHLAKFELNLKNGVDQDEDHVMSCIFNLQLIAMNEEKEGITVDHFYKK